MQKRSEVEAKFEVSRRNLLSVVIFSVINVLLVLLNTQLSFLFSATCPMFVVQIGQGLSEDSGDTLFLLIATVISFVIVAFYLVCYFLTKKHRVFMLIALILFSLDTLFLVWTMTLMFELSDLIDIAFHIWIMYYLVVGIKAWVKLKKLPFDEPDEQLEENKDDRTRPLRPQSPKGKVILSQTYGSLEIVVKRVFGTTELIVNGMVYAEKTGVVETSYTIDAYVENAYITVTMDSFANMELSVNGSLLAKKRRMI